MCAIVDYLAKPYLSAASNAASTSLASCNTGLIGRFVDRVQLPLSIYISLSLSLSLSLSISLSLSLSFSLSLSLLVHEILISPAKRLFLCPLLSLLCRQKWLLSPPSSLSLSHSKLLRRISSSFLPSSAL
jgi:hypothetical protein